MNTSARSLPFRVFFLASSFILWTACAGPKTTTLVCGGYSVQISPEGAVLSVHSRGAALKSAGPGVAGEIIYGAGSFPLADPIQSSPVENGVRFVYAIKDPPLRVEVVYGLAPGQGAVVLSRGLTLRSEDGLQRDLTVRIPLDPLALTDETWLPLKNGTGSRLGSARAALYRFAGTAPAVSISLGIPMVTFPANPLSERCTVVTDPAYSTLFTRNTVEWTCPQTVGLENNLEKRSIAAVLHQGDPEWTAFSNFPNVKQQFPFSVPVAMNLKGLHERLSYARSRGFRVALYFADGMNAGDGLAGIFQPDRVLYWGGWQGPDTKGKTYCQNPLHPEVRSFFMKYIRALLREYGQDIDALVWDETFHVDTGSLGSAQVPGYADRAMMRLVRDLTSEVRAHNRDSGRRIAFLASDCIGVFNWLNKPPYALVADGTYQDTHCDPAAWSYGIFPNFRNVLWSCNWDPVTHFDYTEFGVRNYQAAVAISNGWGDYQGFSKLSAEMKKKVLDLFNRRKRARTKLHWFLELPDFREKPGAGREKQ